MSVLRAIVKELLGLVVEDFSLAFAILTTLAFAYFLLPILVSDSTLQAFIWVNVLVLVLLENVYRGARKLRH